MEKVSEGFLSIFDELQKMRERWQGMANMVKLLEHELATERAERKRLQALVTQIKDHAQMIAEEAERGEPIIPLPGVALNLIETDVRDELSLKLAIVDTQALAAHSNPGKDDWLVEGMHSNPTNKLAGSYVLSGE